MVKYCQFWENCHQHALVKLKYCGITVCKDHYVKNIEARVEKALTHYHMKPPGPTHWLVPLSGSAASQVLLEILSKVATKSSETRSPLNLTAVYVDLGDLSPTKDLVLAACAQHSVPCITIDLKAECGLCANDLITAAATTTATATGGGRLPVDPHAAAEALTYQVLCRKACELGATRIATEHTLVDEATGLFKKFLGMDVGELAREHSWERVGEAYSSQAMKVRPLIEVSDEEVRLYARVCGIKYAVLEGPCRVPPYDPVRKHLLEIELDRVGNMLNIVRRFHKVFMPLIEPFAQQSGGVVCGETDGARSLDKALLESLIPLNDVSGDEDQAVPCAKCRLLGGVSPNGLCRACTVLESVANCSTGAITDETAPASVCKVIFKGNGDEEEEYKFFISTDVRGIRAKKKDRLKDDTNVTVSN